MDTIKLFESELRIMDFIWQKGEPRAKDIAAHCLAAYAWTKNTTYTIINKLIAKGYIERREPGFVCVPLIAQENVRLSEAKSVAQRFFGGSYKLMFTELISAEAISESEIKELKDMIGRA